MRPFKDGYLLDGRCMVKDYVLTNDIGAWQWYRDELSGPNVYRIPENIPTEFDGKYFPDLYSEALQPGQIYYTTYSKSHQNISDHTRMQKFTYHNEQINVSLDNDLRLCGYNFTNGNVSQIAVYPITKESFILKVIDSYEEFYEPIPINSVSNQLF